MKMRTWVKWAFVILCGLQLCGCASTTEYRQHSVYMRVRPAMEKNVYIVDVATIDGLWTIPNMKPGTTLAEPMEYWLEKFPLTFDFAKSGRFITTNSTIDLVMLPTLRVTANEWGNVTRETQSPPNRYRAFDASIAYEDSTIILRPPLYNGNMLHARCEPKRNKTRVHGAFVDVSKGNVQQIYYFDVNTADTEWMRILDVRQVITK